MIISRLGRENSTTASLHPPLAPQRKCRTLKQAFFQLLLLLPLPTLLLLLQAHPETALSLCCSSRVQVASFCFALIAALSSRLRATLTSPICRCHHCCCCCCCSCICCCCCYVAVVAIARIVVVVVLNAAVV